MPHAVLGPQAKVDLLGQRDGEGVALERRAVLAGVSLDGREVRLVPAGRCAGELDGSKRRVSGTGLVEPSDAGNPQAPSTSTRTPMPSLSVSLRSSMFPFFVITYWRRSDTARASAYDAPAPSAASTAAFARSCTEPTLTRPGSDAFTTARRQTA
jgi:hypothetical protein